MRPTEIKAIYDNGGDTFDRYTVALNTRAPNQSGIFDCLGLSEDPTSAQGFSQFGTCIEGVHLGVKVEWGDLSPQVQDHIVQRLATNQEA